MRIPSNIIPYVILTELSCPVTSEGLLSCARMFFASTFPSSTPIWSAIHTLTRPANDGMSNVPKELIPQMTPWVKILCSYRAIKAPSVLGVKSGNKILLLGRFPSNTLLFTSASLALLPSSLRTCSSVLPNANASGCAKKLESKMRWCFELAMGLWVVAGAMKSAGINFVP